MKVIVYEQTDMKEDELHLYCHSNSKQIERIRQYAENIYTTIQTKVGDQTVLIQPEEICYIESVDRKTFIYTVSESLECSLKLYEAESLLEPLGFTRATKSSLVNIRHIKKVVPQLNRNLLLTLNNNEKLEMSRRYVKTFREKLGME